MAPADIPLGMRLKMQAGWNQTEADWHRFLQLGGEGCFVALWDELPVATASTCIFGSVGWIAMVLVDQDYRHQGLATRLVQHALEYFERRGVATARLDATALGQPVYQRLGFTAEYMLTRMEGIAVLPADPAAATNAEQGAANLDAMSALDIAATGTPRAALLARLMIEQPQQCWTVGEPDRLAGFAMSRAGSRAAQIGPAAALTPVAGSCVLDRALEHWSGSRVYVDVPSANAEAVRWARDRGLVVQRTFVRMFRGRRVVDQPGWLWASSGPEKG